jgi:hypothetical protein
MQEKTRRIAIYAIVIAAVLLSYVLSYSAAGRLGGGQVFDSGFYKPVEWLIDETPLREPLFW